MRIRDAELRGLPVVTERGEKVGKVAAIVLDAERHEVVHYVVAKSRLLSALLPDDLLIAPPQVVSIDEERMVVEDNAVAEKVAKAINLGEHAAGHATGVSRSSTEG
jgi:sporulation protein YlmC with PRC-barrel domain